MYPLWMPRQPYTSVVLTANFHKSAMFYLDIIAVWNMYPSEKVTACIYTDESKSPSRLCAVTNYIPYLRYRNVVRVPDNVSVMTTELVAILLAS